MSHSFNHPLRRSLIKQLVHIDENRLELLSQYLSSTPIREKNYKFLDQYVSEVETFLLSFDSQPEPTPPKVFIGSEVTVAYDEQDVEQFTICFPEEIDPDRGCISFLSPIGRQLLLRGREEQVSLVTPSGETTVKIKQVRFREYI